MSAPVIAARLQPIIRYDGDPDLGVAVDITGSDIVLYDVMGQPVDLSVFISQVLGADVADSPPWRMDLSTWLRLRIALRQVGIGVNEDSYLIQEEAYFGAL